MNIPVKLTFFIKEIMYNGRQRSAYGDISADVRPLDVAICENADK